MTNDTRDSYFKLIVTGTIAAVLGGLILFYLQPSNKIQSEPSNKIQSEPSNKIQSEPSNKIQLLKEIRILEKTEDIFCLQEDDVNIIAYLNTFALISKCDPMLAMFTFKVLNTCVYAKIPGYDKKSNLLPTITIKKEILSRCHINRGYFVTICQNTTIAFLSEPFYKQLYNAYTLIVLDFAWSNVHKEEYIIDDPQDFKKLIITVKDIIIECSALGNDPKYKSKWNNLTNYVNSLDISKNYSEYEKYIVRTNMCYLISNLYAVDQTSMTEYDVLLILTLSNLAFMEAGKIVQKDNSIECLGKIMPYLAVQGALDSFMFSRCVPVLKNATKIQTSDPYFKALITYLKDHSKSNKLSNTRFFLLSEIQK